MCDQMLKRVRGAVPARVVAYDAAARRARVQPGTHMLLDDGTSMPRAPLSDVPVVMPAVAGWAIVLPVAVGDTGLLVYCDRDISGFKQTGQPGPLPTDRIQAEQDCVFLPGFGISAVTPASTSGVSIQSDDGSTAVIVEAGHIQLDADRVTVNYQGGSVSWP